ALFRAGWRFARGRGAVPRVNALIPETTFERVEAAAGPLPEAAEAVLERFYLVKVNSLQFFGPLNFGLGFWDGLESLALTFPAARCLGRAPGGPRAPRGPRARGVGGATLPSTRVCGTSRRTSVLGTRAGRAAQARFIAWSARWSPSRPAPPAFKAL